MEQLTDFEIQLKLSDAAVIIEEVMRDMPPGKAGKLSGDKYDNAYFAMVRAIGALMEADCILTDPATDEEE